MDIVRITDLTRQYLELAEASPASLGDLKRVESALGIVLPDDLKAISPVFGGGNQFGGLSINELSADVPYDNVVSKTEELRASIKLPDRYVVLAEPPESLIVLETKGDPAMDTPVTWLADFDAERLATGEPLIDADVFDSYTDFFAFLLDQELQEREELAQ